MTYCLKPFGLSCFVSFIFFIPGYGQNGMAGIYERPFSKLNLNCDSSFLGSHILSKDTINSTGRWSQQKNKIIFHTDSVWAKDLKARNIVSAINIKDSFLCNSKLTRAGYRKIKLAAKEGCLPRRVKPFSEYKKIYEFKLKRTAPFDCSKAPRPEGYMRATRG